MRPSIGLLLPVLLVAACSSQKNTDYAGDPLAQVHGTIITSSSAPAPADARVGIGWASISRAAQFSVDVRGQFPAKFSLDIVSTPPPELMVDLTEGGKEPDEVPISIGLIFAYSGPPGAITNESAPLGLVEDFVVAYVARDAVPGSLVATFLGGPLRAGFHLMKVSRHPHDSPAWEKCIASLPDAPWRETFAKCHALDVFDTLSESPQGFKDGVTLRLAPKEELDVPNWN